MGLFLLSHGLMVLLPSPGPTDAFPSDFTSKPSVLACCFGVRKEREGAELPRRVGSASRALVYPENSGGNNPNPAVQKRSPRPFPRLISRLIFRNSFV